MIQMLPPSSPTGTINLPAATVIPRAALVNTVQDFCRYSPKMQTRFHRPAQPLPLPMDRAAILLLLFARQLGRSHFDGNLPAP